MGIYYYVYNDGIIKMHITVFCGLYRLDLGYVIVVVIIAPNSY